jgi:uncharacterized protein YqeY
MSNQEIQEQEQEAEGKVVDTFYKEQCIACTHYNPSGAKTFNNCHYSRGNDLCPAATRIASVGFSAERAAQRYAEAAANNDYAKMQKILAKVMAQPEQVQAHFGYQQRFLIATDLVDQENQEVQLLEESLGEGQSQQETGNSEAEADETQTHVPETQAASGDDDWQ